MAQLTPHQIKALDRKTHISLTANAGSGKTFVLSKRFVEIILNEDVDLNSVVAITFTDKAAGELNKKIAGEIEERIKEEANPEKRKRLESFRRQLVSANISTIHSFCINVLKEFAPEAGIDANFVPIDRPTSDELIQLSIEETIGGLIGHDDYKDELKYLMRFFGSKRILSAELEKSIQHRRVISRLKNELYNQAEKEIAEFFRNTFEKVFDEIFSRELKKGLSVVELINKKVLAKKRDNSDAINIQALLRKYSGQKTSLKNLS
ncbi:MAG: UvrD-helicase domain-containing protein [Bacteroidetes bacterium]|nr:UvrD-helicase domain-containing protein [Bacteroidota bacterium]